MLPNDNPRLYNPYLYPAVDWANELFNDWGHNRRANINIRGGAPKASYYASLSYYGENGMTRNFKLENYNTSMKYERYNFTSNLNLKPTTKTAIDLGFSAIWDKDTIHKAALHPYMPLVWMSIRLFIRWYCPME